MKKLLTLSAVGILSLTTLEAQSTYTAGHGDIGAGYDDVLVEFEPHWHLHSGAVVDGTPLAAEGEYEPGDLVAQTVATRNSPSGSSSLLGVADGTEVFVLGSATYPPNLGFGVEELDQSDWTGDITITLLGVSGPAGGEMAMYTKDVSDSVVDGFFSSFDPAATVLGNSFTLTPGDHTHFEWAFTHAGSYDLELQWEGTHAVDGLITTTAHFELVAVPEPSALTLLVLAAAFGAWGRMHLRRRFIQKHQPAA